MLSLRRRDTFISKQLPDEAAEMFEIRKELAKNHIYQKINSLNTGYKHSLKYIDGQAIVYFSSVSKNGKLESQKLSEKIYECLKDKYVVYFTKAKKGVKILLEKKDSINLEHKTYSKKEQEKEPEQSENNFLDLTMRIEEKEFLRLILERDEEFHKTILKNIKKETILSFLESLFSAN